MIRNFVPIRKILQMPPYDKFSEIFLRDFANKYDISCYYSPEFGFLLDLDELNQKLPFVEDDLSNQYRSTLYKQRFAQIKLNVLRTAGCITLWWLLYGTTFAPFSKKTQSIHPAEKIFIALANSFYSLTLFREIQEKTKQVELTENLLDNEYQKTFESENNLSTAYTLAKRSHARAKNELKFLQEESKVKSYFNKKNIKIFLEQQYNCALKRKLNENTELEYFIKQSNKYKKETIGSTENWLFILLKDITTAAIEPESASEIKLEDVLEKFLQTIQEEYNINLNKETN